MVQKVSFAWQELGTTLLLFMLLKDTLLAPTNGDIPCPKLKLTYVNWLCWTKHSITKSTTGVSSARFNNNKTRKTDICTFTFVKRASCNQENQLDITNLRLLWYAVYYLDQASFFFSSILWLQIVSTAFFLYMSFFPLSPVPHGTNLLYPPVLFLYNEPKSIQF